MFSRSFRIGRIAGITINIDISWFAIFVLLVFLLGYSYFPLVLPGISAGWYWFAAVITTLLFFASVLFHEFAHSLVARGYGIPVSSITLFIFGGVSQIEDEPTTPVMEFIIAIVGPLSSIVLAAVLFGISLLSAAAGSRLWLMVFTYLWFINLLLGIFNLLPGFPLDGGRVLRAAIWHSTGDLVRATRIAAATGQAFGWIFIVLGVASLFYPPLRAYATIWLALIGWFLITAARSSYRQLVLREALRNVPISAVMNASVTTVPADITLEQLVREFFLRESPSILAVEEDGRLIGTIGIDDVQTVPRNEWPARTAGQVARPINEARVVRPDEDAWNAANRMAQTNSDSILVTEEGGQVDGIVTQGSIIRWLQMHTNLAPGQA